MTDPKSIERALRTVHDGATFVRELLVGALSWPIEAGIEEIDDITFEWSRADLEALGVPTECLKGTIRQIRPFPGNPWGVFILEFDDPTLFSTARGMTGVLRRLLRGLVARRRRVGNLPAFRRENLLFVCNHDYVHYRFAHFKAPHEEGAVAPLAAFGWGPGDPIRTVCEANLGALGWPEDDVSEADWISAWSQAFDVEKVTQRFYEDYAAVFSEGERLIGESTALGGDQLRRYTQLLFNRLMFLRFVERKGWLKFPGAEGRDYLRPLCEAGGIGKKNLFDSRLKPLFFQGLTVPGEQERPEFGSVPFLNGGLFEPSELDRKVKTLPDEVFAPVIGREGLFYRFNFTVEESTPLEIEVAVDPEMLGQVFEKLVVGRHQKGSYYTPRPIVTYMCREGLKRYLAKKTTASREAIGAVVEERSPALLSPDQRVAVQGALDEIRVIDPACGSGAYLLGFMHELVELRQTVADAPLEPYALKLQVIERNLYGADIDSFATNIAMLRMWLALAVDAREPVALPNLDFKIECGDSLAGPCDAIGDSLMSNLLRKGAAPILEAKRRFLTSVGEAKDVLRKAIRSQEKELKRQLSEHNPYDGLDWHVAFAEVFARGGFDVAVANPPYVSALEAARTMPEAYRQGLAETYTTAHGAYDLYVLFFERGLQCLGSEGVLCFITPNKYLSAPYAVELRKHLLASAMLVKLVDISSTAVFREVSVYPVLTFLEKSAKAGAGYPVELMHPVRRGALDFRSDFTVSAIGNEMLKMLPECIWGFLLSNQAGLLARMLKGAVPLERLGEINATSTAAEADEYGKKLSDRGGPGAFKVLNTGTIDAYRSLWGVKPMTNARQKYLTPYLKGSVVGARRKSLYGTPKIIFAKMAKRCEAYLDAEGLYAGLNVNCFYQPKRGVPIEYYLGYVHSRVFEFFYVQLFGALRMSGGYFQFQAPQLRAMPALDPKKADTEAVSGLVRRMIRAVEAGGTDRAQERIQEELDDVFFSSFGLSGAERSRLVSACLSEQGEDVAAVAGEGADS